MESKTYTVKVQKPEIPGDLMLLRTQDKTFIDMVPLEKNQGLADAMGARELMYAEVKVNSSGILFVREVNTQW